jgi:hypothetical protein
MASIRRFAIGRPSGYFFTSAEHTMDTSASVKPSSVFSFILYYILDCGKVDNALTEKAEPPPTRGVNRGTGTDSANGGWLR